jgi:hypothetical protein
LKLQGDANPAVWALKYGRVDGAPFSFKGHEFLRQIYEDLHHYIVLEKASQMGATIYALNARVFWPCSQKPVSTIFYMPTSEDVHDLSKIRVKSMVQESEYLSELIDKSEVDSVGVKRIGYGACYFRGMGGKVKTKSVPADYLVFDELDEMEPKMKAQALNRIAHSRYGYVLEMSTPTVPDYGIDEEFQKSDQHFWIMKCSHCEYPNIAEDDFPNNVLYEWNAKDSSCSFAELVCAKCKKPLDTQVGKWVPKFPSRTERRGYHLSQLFSTFVNLKELMKEYLTGRRRQIFFNHRLGLPYIDAKGRITMGEVLACRREYQLNDITQHGCWAGCDQGDILHVVVGDTNPATNRPRIVWLGALKSWDDLNNVLRRHEVKRLVIDAMPNKDSAKRLGQRFRGRVWLCWYDKEKGNVKWDEPNEEVHVDRTETLDSVFEDLRAQEIELPMVEEIDVVAKHCHNLVKTQEEDEETGEVKWRYIRTGDDHYAHALNYFKIAYKSFSPTGQVIVASPNRRRSEFDLQ